MTIKNIIISILGSSFAGMLWLVFLIYYQISDRAAIASVFSMLIALLIYDGLQQKHEKTKDSRV